MNKDQFERLKELKSKYLWKYVIYPGIIMLSNSKPFNLGDLKNASNALMSL
jgi:hypothetical protein